MRKRACLTASHKKPRVEPQPVAKHRNSNYFGLRVYIPQDVYLKFKLTCIEEGKEMSEEIENLIRDWLKNH